MEHTEADTIRGSPMAEIDGRVIGISGRMPRGVVLTTIMAVMTTQLDALLQA